MFTENIFNNLKKKFWAEKKLWQEYYERTITELLLSLLFNLFPKEHPYFVKNWRQRL